MSQPTDDKNRNADSKADKLTDAASADRELSSAELASVAGGKSEKMPSPDEKRA